MRIAGLLLLFAIWAGGCSDDCPTCPAELPSDGEVEIGGRAWRVPGDFPTIAAALAAAAVGDTVLIAAGTYAEYDLELASGLVLRGASTGDDHAVIDAGGRGRVFRASGLDSLVVLCGLTLTGGYLTEYSADGAAINCVGSRLRAIDCVFVDNAAANGEGGGIAAYGSSLELINCRFEYNTSAFAGGGVFADYRSDLAMSECFFARNGAVRGKGGLTAYGAVELSGCVFEDNDDGAAYVGDGSLVSNCVFRGNRDGGLQVRDGCKVDNCLFVDNIAYGGAAGLYGGSDLEVTGSVFIGNRSFEGNFGESDGGGLRVYGNGLVVADCAFIDNEASGRGGGLKALNAVISNTLFRGNRAPSGGGIYAADLDLESCEFIGNYGNYGAAVLCSSGQLDGCVLAGNSGLEWVLMTGTTSTLEHCTIAGNTVDPGGALLYFGYTGDASRVTDCILSFNTGVPVADESITPLLDHCDLYGNTGGDWVGGLAEQEGRDGNFSLDPWFCDLDQANVALCTDSPCLPVAGGYDRIIGARDNGCVSCGD